MSNLTFSLLVRGLAVQTLAPATGRLIAAGHAYARQDEAYQTQPNRYIQVVMTDYFATGVAGAGLRQPVGLSNGGAFVLAPGQTVTVQSNALGTAELYWLLLDLRPEDTNLDPITVGRPRSYRQTAYDTVASFRAIKATRKTGGVGVEVCRLAYGSPAPVKELTGPAIVIANRCSLKVEGLHTRFTRLPSQSAYVVQPGEDIHIREDHYGINGDLSSGYVAEAYIISF